MKLIKADQHRRLELPGVPGTVRRPVDIDKSKTGFVNLRSLRIYCFDVDSVINGHAEEDELLIVVMAGSVELTISEGSSVENPRQYILSAVSEARSNLCAAYLPPHAAYKLVPQHEAVVAYARATPAGGRSAAVFSSHLNLHHAEVVVLLEESTYPQRLRIRVLQISALQNDIAVTPIEESEDICEALVHVRMMPSERVATIAGTDGVMIPLASWDTIAVTPGARPTLRVALGSSALVLIVMAK